jgi:hypothetical protein
VLCDGWYRTPMDQAQARTYWPTGRRPALGSQAPLAGGPARRRLLVATAAVIGLVLAAAACGGPPKAGVASLGATTTVAPARTAATGGQSASGAVELARCMRSHGILNFPDPASLATPAAIKAWKSQVHESVASMASSARFQAAQRACAPYWGQPATAPQVSPAEMQKLLAVSRCMRAHGVPDFPDPNPTTGALNTPAGLDKSSPRVLAALRACSSLGRAAGLGPPSTGQ